MNKKTILISISVIVVLVIAAAITISIFLCDDSAQQNNSSANSGEVVNDEKIGATSVEEFGEIIEKSVAESDFEKYLTIMPEFYTLHLEKDEHAARLEKQNFEEYCRSIYKFSCVIEEQESDKEIIRAIEEKINQSYKDEFGIEYDAQISDCYHAVLKESKDINDDGFEDKILVIEMDGFWYFYE